MQTNKKYPTAIGNQLVLIVVLQGYGTAATIRLAVGNALANNCERLTLREAVSTTLHEELLWCIQNSALAIRGRDLNAPYRCALCERSTRSGKLLTIIYKVVGLNLLLLVLGYALAPEPT